MPSRRVHRLDAQLHGYSDRVNSVIDGPYSWLGGKHRILFHDPLSAMAVSSVVDPEGGPLGGLRHVILDQAGSADRETREAMEAMAAIIKPPKKGIRVVWDRPKKYKILRIC